MIRNVPFNIVILNAILTYKRLLFNKVIHDYCPIIQLNLLESSVIFLKTTFFHSSKKQLVSKNDQEVFIFVSIITFNLIL